MASDDGTPHTQAPMTRALRSPLALILLVVGAIVGVIWLGAPGVLLGLVAYGAGALLSLPKAPPSPSRSIDPFGVNEPWRQFVQSALRSQRHFADGVNATREGPIREHLQDLGQRVDAAVNEVWRVAKRGNTIAKARRQVDEAELHRKIEQLRPEPGADDPGDSAAKTVEALEAQLATGARLDELLEGAQSQLELLDARLAESVTRAHELAATADDTADLDPLGEDLDSIVTEMESLRAALDETRTIGSTDAKPPSAPPAPSIGPGDEAGAIPPMPPGVGAPVEQPATTDDDGEGGPGPTAPGAGPTPTT